jgi:micrococcal nuclease
MMATGGRAALAAALVSALVAGCSASPEELATTQSSASSSAPGSTAAGSPAQTSYPHYGRLVAARLVRVIDGDTIKVELNGKAVSVRYIGMDAPETVDPRQPVAWMGPQATAANAELLARGGGTVYIEKDVSETDRYGRLLRYVWVKTNGTYLMVDLELLRLGVAQVATFPPDVKYIDPWFLDAEAQARSAGIGLWGPTPTPAAGQASGAAALVAVCGGNRNAPGDDNLNLNGEYVVICNRGTSAVSLAGWRLTDDGDNHTFTFPAFALSAAAKVTIYSGSGRDTSTALFWRSDGAIWNNDGDCAHLFTVSGAAVSSRCL